MLIALGLLVALAPFLGLPTSWLEILLPIIAVAIIALGYSFSPHREKIAPQPREVEQTMAA